MAAANAAADTSAETVARNSVNRTVYPHTLKIALLGNTKTGKTSILRSLQGKPLEEETEPTIGIDCRDHTFAINDMLYNLQIWDSAGMKEYHTISQSICRRVDGILIVYSADCTKSLKHIQYWLRAVPQTTPLMIVGNKSDIQPCAVKAHDMDRFATERGCKHMFISVKNNTGITEAFSDLIADINCDADAEHRRNMSEGSFKLTDTEDDDVVRSSYSAYGSTRKCCV